MNDNINDNIAWKYVMFVSSKNCKRFKTWKIILVVKKLDFYCMQTTKHASEGFTIADIKD